MTSAYTNYALVSLAILLTGCGGNANRFSTRIPSNPQIADIPIAVHVHVFQGETLGNPTNRGCRFGVAEIKEILEFSEIHCQDLWTDRAVRFLYRNHSTGQLQLEFDINCINLIDENVATEDIGGRDALRYSGTDSLVEKFFSKFAPLQSRWIPFHLNTIFAGSLEGPTGPGAAFGLAYDSSERCPNHFVEPLIMVADLGFSADFVKKDFVLLHEMTHHFWDLLSATTFEGERSYDESEHLDRGSSPVPPVYSIVMEAVGLLEARMPGDFDVAGTEKSSIKSDFESKINSGRINGFCDP